MTTVVSDAGFKFADNTVISSAPVLAAYAPIAGPIFTGNVGGITKAMVDLANADNTSDVNKPVSTAQATAINTKQANLGYNPVQQGTGIRQGSNVVKLGWTNAQLAVTIDSTDIGDIVTTTLGEAAFLKASNNYQMNSLGIGTAPSGTAGEIRATNNITSYYSDDRLKTRLGNIENALDKVDTLDAFYYEANEIAQELGYKPRREVGISAQQVQAVMPETVAPAPIDDKYLTVRYERLVPLLIAAIKELRIELAALKVSAT